LFMRLLLASLASGYAHVADKDGNEPEEPQRWGWRPGEFRAGEGTSTEHSPQGLCIGWLVEGELYLEPEASFAAVQRLARDQNESFAITANTLRRRLREKGLLATTDVARGKLTVRKTLQGERRDVLHILWNGAVPGPKTGPNGPETENPNHTRPVQGARGWAGNGQADQELAPQTAQTNEENGVMGQSGRSRTGSQLADDVGEHAAEGWGAWQ